MRKIDERSYTFRVQWSEEDGCHIAKCIEFPLLTAHGKQPEEALKQIQRVVAASIRWMKRDGESIPEPLGMKTFRGVLTLRVPPEVHRELAICAAEEGVSINQYVLARVAKG